MSLLDPPLVSINDTVLQTRLTKLFQRFLQHLIHEGDTFDTLRSDYIIGIMMDTLKIHVKSVTKSKTLQDIEKLESSCFEELKECFEINLEEELETSTTTSKKEQTKHIEQFIYDAIQIAYGRTIETQTDDTASASTASASSASPSSSSTSVRSAGGPPGFAPQNASAAAAAAPSAGKASTPSPSNVDDSDSSLDPLTDLLSDIFPLLPRPQIEAVLLASGGLLDPCLALDLAGEILSTCSGKTLPQHPSKGDLEPWSNILQTLPGTDEKYVYKTHLQTLKYKQAKEGTLTSAASASALTSSSSTILPQNEQFYYDRPEPSLKRTTSNGSNSSSASTSTTTNTTSQPPPQRDAYYDSEEFQQIKKNLISQYTYDHSKPGTFHRPHVKFESRPKHHKRYLDNEVVNTRGEKYTILVDPEEAAREAAWKATHKPLKVITKRKGGVGHKII